MEVYTPVIRLPSKRKTSITPSNHSNLGEKGCLVSDTLFLSKLPANIKETDIRTLLQHCLPTEIVLDREKNSGQLRFSEPKYADRAYSLYNGFTFTNKSQLELQMYQNKSLDPEATAALLEINNLPEHYDNNQLYDLFRPFGPLNLCKCVLFEGASRGSAFIQYFFPSDSDDAITSLNDHLVEGNQLSVVSYMPTNQQQQQQEETEVVDIMNLYIKNLEPHITSNELNQAFRKFGRIISAKVMTNPATGQSKGYGFVSFGKSEEAANALKEMNGAMLGNRPLVVAYHEPRKPRQSYSTNQQQSYNQQQPYNNNGYNHQQSYNNRPQQQSYNSKGYNNDYSSNESTLENENEKLKDLSIGQKPAVNLPQRKNPDIKSSTSPVKSLASLASGLSIQQAPTVVHRPTLRRRGSLESVMTESSANIQRQRLTDAVRHCGDFGKDVDDIVDMLLTLKRKERSLCLFNPDFLREKVQLALEALATCVDSDSEEDQLPEVENDNNETRHSEIDSLLASLEGKPVRQKKQLLGDKLFPLVKSTGTKQAPKVTIHLLDTVDLTELAHIMYDTPLLRTRVQESFESL